MYNTFLEILPYLLLLGFILNRSTMHKMQEEIQLLKDQIRNINKFPEKKIYDDKSIVSSTSKPYVQSENSSSSIPSQSQFKYEDILNIIKEDSFIPAKETKDDVKKEISFEQQFGARLPVWIGGIALALAGFFMVKYSIENNILSPAVRIVLGMIFGVGMLYGASWVRSKDNFSNGTRISQALSGAGIADLYICIFAATNLYNFIPSFIGFLGMAIVTVLAVILSLQYGMPIALLGLVGGFLTPAMMGLEDLQIPILSIYLYFVLTGFMVVIRKQRWWMISIPTVLCTFIWILACLSRNNFSSEDSTYLSLFLMAISGTIVKLSKQQYDQKNIEITERFQAASILNYIALGGAILLMGIITSHAGFGFMEWGLFALLSLGGIGLAFFDQKLYGFVPWLSMLVNAIMFMAWDDTNAFNFSITISIFAAIYIVSGYFLQSRSEKPLLWAGLIAATSIIYYLITFYKFNNFHLFNSIPFLWGRIAFVFAWFGAFSLYDIIRKVPDNHPQKQNLMAIYASTATAFLSIALTIEFTREFLATAFAAQLFAMVWINNKLDVKAMRYITSVLTCICAFLLIGEMTDIIFMIFNSNIKITYKTMIFQYGLPALFFAMSSHLLHLQKDDKLVQSLEILSIILIIPLVCSIASNIFSSFSIIYFIQRGIVTNIFFISGLACLWMGRNYMREAITSSGLTLFVIAIYRIIFFDLFLNNPLWTSEMVGGTPVFNGLLVNYGFPILLLWKIIPELRYAGKISWIKYMYSFTFLLVFTFLSLNIRQMFHGTYLNGYIPNVYHHSTTSNIEIYTYSIVWLLFGIGLLFFGTLKENKMVRIASLIVMILTVGKVFLYDASNLEGLLRVFSFFGLGLSLMGLSWFYTRFVFGSHNLLNEIQNHDIKKY